MNFNYNLPVNILFGRGRINDVGKEVSKYGKKVLIVTGKNSTKKTGLLDKTIDLLKDSKIEYEVFDRVEQNPLITTIYSIANHFNVNPVWLMGYNVEKNLKLTDDKIDLSTEEKILIEKFKKLDSEDKIKVLAYTDLLSSQNKYKNSKIIELSKQEKQVWEESGKEHLMPVACHDDNLTDEEKAIVSKKINEILNNLDKY